MPRKTSISLQKLAASRGGKCLSSTYRTLQDKVEWECSKGHKWYATIHAVFHINTWCPQCSIGIGENICRLYFETIFQKPFIKIKPSWLLNEKNNRLELDGYCAQLGIAYEYNGEQHYTEVKMWNKRSLSVRQAWDALKIQLCKENNVKLIVIPQLYTRLKLKNLQNFIKLEMIKQDIIVPNNYDNIQFDLSKLTETVAFTEYKRIAESKGGKCLSNVYLNNKTKLEWQCEKGHVWQAKSLSIKRGSWCPYCAGKATMKFNKVKELVESKSGTLLSNEYKNSMKKLEIKCNICEHEWWASVNSIKHGYWCPNCAGLVKLTIEKMQKIATGKNGKCLSTIYVNAQDNLTWQCNDCDTIWNATPTSIKNNGTWCPMCANERRHGRARLTMEDMHNIATTRNGQCLSTVYVSSQDNLKWQCNVCETIWDASPTNIKHAGTWCPKCRKNWRSK
jgi:hypothetical protein